MISGQVPKLIRDQFDRPSNVHGKTGFGMGHIIGMGVGADAGMLLLLLS